MAAVLDDFVRGLAGAPFKYGECDCLLVLADWIRVRTGKDPARGLRKTYSDDAGWKRIVAAAGGMVPLVEGIVLRAGLVPVSAGDVEEGDLAVVQVKGVTYGGIKVPRGWVLKLNRSLTIVRAQPLAAWRIT